MKKQYLSGILLLGISFMFSCTKNNESPSNSNPTTQQGQTVDDSKPLSGAIKGTMLAGKTYTVNGDITINAKDTLMIQPGVTVNFNGPYFIIVKGVLLSNGSKDKPVYLTSPSGHFNTDPNLNPQDNDAFKGLWGGVYGDTTCSALVLRWTHINFTGAPTVVDNMVGGVSSGTQFSVYFANVNGYCVLENSWFYGSTDDCVRFAGGKIACIGNTFEDCGPTGGDVLNAKHGTTGVMAYNLFIGCATNGTKASNKGTGAGPETNIDMYNNTYLNCGYRRVEAGRGACINYEEGSEGRYYNNLMVDCRFGPRVVNIPVADTANMKYGNSFQYGDSVSVVDQFYPQSYITIPKSSDIPAFTSFLPSSYKLGDSYDAPSLVGKNNPQFVNYSLPQYKYQTITWASGFDFHLKSTSPCINKGYTGFTPLSVVPIDPVKGATAITPPGKDMGAYQMDGSGNQH